MGSYQAFDLVTEGPSGLRCKSNTAEAAVVTPLGSRCPAERPDPSASSSSCFGADGLLFLTGQLARVLGPWCLNTCPAHRSTSFPRTAAHCSQLGPLRALAWAPFPALPSRVITLLV